MLLLLLLRGELLEPARLQRLQRFCGALQPFSERRAEPPHHRSEAGCTAEMSGHEAGRCERDACEEARPQWLAEVGGARERGHARLQGTEEDARPSADHLQRLQPHEVADHDAQASGQGEHAQGLGR